MKVGDTVIYTPNQKYLDNLGLSPKFFGKRVVIRFLDWSYDPTAEIEFLDNPGLRLKTYVSYLTELPN